MVFVSTSTITAAPIVFLASSTALLHNVHTIETITTIETIETIDPEVNYGTYGTYGVDVSFPIHRHFDDFDDFDDLDDAPAETTETTRLFGQDRVHAYRDFMQGCYDYYQHYLPPQSETSDKSGKSNNSNQSDKPDKSIQKLGHLCHQNERDRMKLNLNQPKSMTNYTEVGYRKTRVSEGTWEMIQHFWSSQKDKRDQRQTSGNSGNFPLNLSNERWPPGNTYTNHWTSPTKMLYVQSNPNLTETLYREVQHHLRQWIPHAKHFTRSSLYGVRVYTSGSILSTHVDRDPLISSAIINVDQNVLEPWPLEVYGHDGRACNITMEPGDIVLYESHSVLHGRPFPLNGEYYANIFVHFAPIIHEEVEPDNKMQSATEHNGGGEL